MCGGDDRSIDRCRNGGRRHEPVEPIVDVGDPDPESASFSEEESSEATPVRAKRTDDWRPEDTDADAADRAAATLRTGGAPLSVRDRRFFEQGFGIDLSRVRVHTDGPAAAAASAIQARAFTTGSHIGFAAGEFAPDTRSGRTLIAHELTHVVQQSVRPGAPVVARKTKPKGTPTAQPCPPRPNDAAAIISMDVDVGTGVLRMTWSRKIGKGTLDTTGQVTIGAGVCGVDCNDPVQSARDAAVARPRGT